jgi:hypothetical protein
MVLVLVNKNQPILREKGSCGIEQRVTKKKKIELFWEELTWRAKKFKVVPRLLAINRYSRYIFTRAQKIHLLTFETQSAAKPSRWSYVGNSNLIL